MNQARTDRLPSTVSPYLRAEYEQMVKVDTGLSRVLLRDITDEHNSILAAWSESSEKKRWIAGNLVIVGVGATICAASWFIFLAVGPYGVHTAPIAALINTLYVALGVTLLGFAAAYLRRQGLFRLHVARFRTERQRERLSEAIIDVGGSIPEGGGNNSEQEDGAELKLPGVWSVTQKRLDFYHSLATEQADKSFRDNRMATALGFSVLLGATVVAGVTASLGGAIAAGVIAGIGGALTAYLSKTFMRTHERASAQLQSYFGQPLAVSRYLAAERLLDQLQGDAKAAAVGDIIRFIAAPGPAAVEDDNQDKQKPAR